MKTCHDSTNQSQFSNYQYHSPNQQKFNYQVPVPQLPSIHQFFPNLGYNKQMMIEIKEMVNDNEPCTIFRGRDRTNSDNWADNVIQQVQSDIKQELNKPSN